MSSPPTIKNVKYEVSRDNCGNSRLFGLYGKVVVIILHYYTTFIYVYGSKLSSSGQRDAPRWNQVGHGEKSTNYKTWYLVNYSVRAKELLGMVSRRQKHYHTMPNEAI